MVSATSFETSGCGWEIQQRVEHSQGQGFWPFAQDFFNLLFEEPLPATQALELFVVVFKEVANPLLGMQLNW